MRYRLLDYFYTALHQAHLDGTPVLQPLWYQYPTDSNTFGIDLQFLFGESILVSPVTQENGTDVSIYLPNDHFYDFKSYSLINGTGATTQLTNVAYTDIPVYIRGGAVLPLRVTSAYTTKQLRQKDFELVVAPGKGGEASGTLYLDDGESLEQSNTYTATYTYKSKQLSVKSQGGYEVGSLKYRNVRILGLSGQPGNFTLNGRNVASNMVRYNDTSKSVFVNVTQPLRSSFTLKWS